MGFCFWGWVKQRGCSEGIFVPRQGRGLQRMQPFLLAVLTSPAPTPSPSIPSVSTPQRFSPGLYPSILLIPSTPAPSLFPSLQLSVHPYLSFLCSVLLCLHKCSSPPVLVRRLRAMLGSSSWADSGHVPGSAAALGPAQCVRSTRNKQGFLCLPAAVSCPSRARMASDVTVVYAGRGAGSGKALATLHACPGSWGRFCGKRVLCVDRNILKEGSSLLPKHGQQEPSSRLCPEQNVCPFK